MRRVIVVGGFGFFGGATVTLLKKYGYRPLIASRRESADIQVDINDAPSIRNAFEQGDIIIDTAGPFQHRSMELIEAAIDMGFDVIDIADSFHYVKKVYALKEKINAKGICVLTACSSVSTITAAFIKLSGIKDPIRLSTLLVPASKHTAQPGTAASLLESIGQPITVLRSGQLTTEPGWKVAKTFCFAKPLGRCQGHLFESADAITLPQIWPSLKTIDCYVNSHVFGFNQILNCAARISILKKLLQKFTNVGIKISHVLGSTEGFFASEIEDKNGIIKRCMLHSTKDAYLTAVIPAVLATKQILENHYEKKGLISPKDHVDTSQLLDALLKLSIDFDIR